jgi:tetratricopeptide (TPR) repeat protein
MKIFSQLKMSDCFLIRMSVIAIVVLLPANVCLASNATDFIAKGTNALEQHNYQLALKFFSKAIQSDTNSVTAYSARGWTYIKENKYDKAIADLSESLRLNPNPFIFSIRGNIYFKNRDYDKAVADYSAAIKLYPSYTNAYIDRANAYLLKGNYDGAIMDCTMAILLNPNLSSAFGIRATAYSFKDYFDRAIFDYSKIIELNQTNALAYADRGLSYSKKGDYSKGIADCKEGIRYDTNCAIAYNNLAWLLAVSPDANLRDGQKAVLYAKRACELGKYEEPHALGTLAAAYAETGDFKEAIKWEKKCIEQSGLLKEEMNQAYGELGLFKQNQPYHEK